VSISMREYFRLMGLACGGKLRRSLDRAFDPSEDRTPERYALFRKKEDGDCPLRMASGWCGLQKECGEGALPSVCRLYPRAIRGGYAYECSCSASCEGVAEALIAKKEKLSFVSVPLRFEMSEDIPLNRDEEGRAFYGALRSRCFLLLQDRSMRLSDRLTALGIMLREVRLRKIICVAALEDVPDERAVFVTVWDASEAQKGFLLMRKVAAWFEENSESLGDYREAAERTYLEKDYQEANKRFEERYPDWEIAFENMMVNHVFYERFPFSDKSGSFREAFFALCGAYAFLRYMAIGYTFENSSPDALADIAAAVFRVAEHSEFDVNVVTMLKMEGLDTVEKMKTILEV